MQSIVNALNATELFTLKWLMVDFILGEFYLKIVQEHIVEE